MKHNFVSQLAILCATLYNNCFKDFHTMTRNTLQLAIKNHFLTQTNIFYKQNKQLSEVFFNDFQSQRVVLSNYINMSFSDNAVLQIFIFLCSILKLFQWAPAHKLDLCDVVSPLWYSEFDVAVNTDFSISSVQLTFVLRNKRSKNITLIVGLNA